MNGGYGYDPIRVGCFTLDMVFMLMTDKENLRSGDKKQRIVQSGDVAASLVGPDGLVKGRDKDGKPMKARIGGQSRASQLIEAKRKREEEARKVQEELDRKTADQLRRRRGRK